MELSTAPSDGNYLLSLLEPQERRRVEQVGERVPLKVGERLNGSLYFVDHGVISMVGGTEEGDQIELAVTGREGVAGAISVLGGNHLPYTLQVQVGGSALKVDGERLTPHLNECGQLMQLVHAYLQKLFTHVAQSAICNRHHTARQRLARWLLMISHLAGTSDLPLTHDHIAQMVGAPRSVVSEAAGELRDAGAVSYSRGRMRILDPEALEKLSCECYEVVRRPLDEFLSRS